MKYSCPVCDWETNDEPSQYDDDTHCPKCGAEL